MISRKLEKVIQLFSRPIFEQPSQSNEIIANVFLAIEMIKLSTSLIGRSFSAQQWVGTNVARNSH
jgi:hypothetical protein